MNSKYRNSVDSNLYFRIKLAGLWVTLMLLYIYCDIYSFHRPDYISEIISGMLGPFKVTQEVLAIFGLLMIMPALMVPACLFLKNIAIKFLNIVIGIFYLCVNIGNLVGEGWVYYWIYGILEIILIIGIITLSLRWKDKKYENS
ncbi:MAG: DUF6326 family protein [Suipraeoptans sp.]